MRFLEICIYIAILLYLLVTFNDKKRTIKWKKELAVIPVILTGVHLIFEGYRWQMMIAYIFAIIVLVLGFRKVGNVLRVLFITLVVLSIAIPTVLPVVALQAPSGSYPVGYMDIYMEDLYREEVFTENEDDYRELSLKVWYPARPYDFMESTGDTEPMTYWKKETVETGMYSGFLWNGKFWYDYVPLIKTNSVENALIAEAESPFPVIIYSHSYGALDTENTMLCEELASQGYVVMSISHTYEAHLTELGDGRVIGVDFEYLRSNVGVSLEDEEQNYKTLIENLENLGTDEEILNTFKVFFNEEGFINAMLDERVKDITLVIDQLEDINEEDVVLKEKLDLENIGVIGFSFGGITGIEASIVDERIEAVVNMDAWPFGTVFPEDKTMTTPLMVLRHDLDGGIEDTGVSLVWECIEDNAETECVFIEVPDTVHGNYTDYVLLFPIMKYLGYLGDKEASELMEVHREETIKFLDKYLKDN